MKSSIIFALFVAGVLAAPTPVAEASPEDLDAGHFLEKAHVWGSYKAADGSVKKREPTPEELDAGHFLEKAYVWGSYKDADGAA